MPCRSSFLVRGFAKVRGEWSLMALCYTSAGCCASSATTVESALASATARLAYIALLRVDHRQPLRCRALASIQQLVRVLCPDVHATFITRRRRTYLPNSNLVPHLQMRRRRKCRSRDRTGGKSELAAKWPPLAPPVRTHRALVRGVGGESP